MTSSNTNGVSTSYEYDSLNRLSTVVDALLGGSGTTSYAYDTAHNLTTRTIPNGFQSILTDHQLNRVTGLAPMYPASSTNMVRLAPSAIAHRRR
jgi:YD repeat-containing protein